jgi:hypothetical protein
VKNRSSESENGGLVGGGGGGVGVARRVPFCMLLILNRRVRAAHGSVDRAKPTN